MTDYSHKVMRRESVDKYYNHKLEPLRWQDYFPQSSSWRHDHQYNLSIEFRFIYELIWRDNDPSSYFVLVNQWYFVNSTFLIFKFFWHILLGLRMCWKVNWVNCVFLRVIIFYCSLISTTWQIYSLFEIIIISSTCD